MAGAAAIMAASTAEVDPMARTRVDVVMKKLLVNDVGCKLDPVAECCRRSVESKVIHGL
jgi:hypothetical protein